MTLSTTLARDLERRIVDGLLVQPTRGAEKQPSILLAEHDEAPLGVYRQQHLVHYGIQDLVEVERRAECARDAVQKGEAIGPLRGRRDGHVQQGAPSGKPQARYRS